MYIEFTCSSHSIFSNRVAPKPWVRSPRLFLYLEMRATSLSESKYKVVHFKSISKIATLSNERV